MGVFSETLSKMLPALFLFTLIFSENILNSSSLESKIKNNAFHEETEAKGHCVMYDACDASNITGNYPCAYNGPAKKLTNDTTPGLDDLRLICPELVEKYGGKFCCAPAQIETLQSNLGLPQAIIGRCPSCFYNFRQIFCELACGPNQSLYLNVTKSVNSTVKPGMRTKIY